VKSPVSAEVFELFVSALEGGAVEITAANSSPLSLLCKKSGFTAFAADLSLFQTQAKFMRALSSAHPLRAIPFGADFTFVINGNAFVRNTAESAALWPAVALQLSVDACERKFSLFDGRMDIPPFDRLFSQSPEVFVGADKRSLDQLFGSLWNPALETAFFCPPFSSDSFSLLSIDAFDSLLSSPKSSSQLRMKIPYFMPFLHSGENISLSCATFDGIF
jgi:hypothetical protein